MPEALIIAHEPDVPAAQVGARLVEKGYELTIHVMVPNPARPTDVSAVPDLRKRDLVVLLGSNFSVTDRHSISWVRDEIDAVRGAHEQGVPFLGICFGGQLLAAALGAEVSRSPDPEIGWTEIDLEPGAPDKISSGPWMQWHYDRFDLPPGAELLASTQVCPQLFRQGRSVGTQFHPEVDGACAKTWMAMIDPVEVADQGINPEKFVSEAAEIESESIPRCHALVDWFVDDVAIS